MGKASAAFGRLQESLWNNHHVSIEVKCKVYRVDVLSALLYGAKTWTIYRSQVKKLHAFMMRHIRQMMNISWQDRITNVEILKRAGLPSMADMLITKGLRWIGHVHRMGRKPLPRQLLYSQLEMRQRNQGRPRLRFKEKYEVEGHQNIGLTVQSSGSSIMEDSHLIENVERHCYQPTNCKWCE